MSGAGRGRANQARCPASVDAGGGWLIFGLSAGEAALHPAEHGGTQELYLMCDDINATVAELQLYEPRYPKP